MKQLDRYIIREFLVNFGILFMVLMSLFVVIDLIVGLDAFVRAGGAHSDRYGGQFFATIMVMVDYYVPVIVMVYVFLSGLIVLGAMGFTIATFQRTRELSAMVASGVSMYRIAAPMLLVGIGLNALSLPIQELVIPDLASKLVRSKSQLHHEQVDSFPVKFARDGQGRLFTAADFDAGEQQLKRLTVIERDASGLTERRITADDARWDEPNQRWRLTNGASITPTLTRPDVVRLVDVTPDPVKFIATDLSPPVLMARRATSYPQLLSMMDLQQMQANDAVEPGQRAHITRIIWGRFSMLVVNVLVLVMGMAFFLRLGETNMLEQAVRAAAVCLTAWGVGLLLIQAGGGMLNPVASAWMPVVLFLPITAALLQLVRT